MRSIYCVPSLKKNGSAPRGVGTQMLVSSDNRIIGTIGGGCAEAEVISHCRRLFRKQEFKCALMDVSMNTDDAEKEGMVCGGSNFGAAGADWMMKLSYINKSR